MTFETKDHEADGANRLTSKWREKTFIGALLNAAMKQIQDLEDACGELRDETLLDTAIGRQLTNLGKKIGQGRVFSDDTIFRLLIRARAKVNRTHGTPLDVLAILNLVCDVPYDYVEFEIDNADRYYPASFMIWLQGEPTIYPVLLAFLCYQAKQAGSRLQLTYPTDAYASSFIWSDGFTTPDNADQGWSWAATGTGGSWANGVSPYRDTNGDDVTDGSYV